MRVMTASSVPPSRPDRTAGMPTTRQPQQASPASRVVRASPMPAVPGRSGGDSGQLGVLFPDGPDLGAGGPEGDELGRALGEVDHGRTQVTAQRRRTATRGAGPATR